MKTRPLIALGGGWMRGSKERVHRFVEVPALLQAGISVAAINYRHVSQGVEEGVKPPAKAPLHDAARALQFVRQADPTRTSNFGVKLQERCAALGMACELVYPGAPGVKHETPQAI